MSGSHLVADEFFSRNEKLELENENKLAMQQASGTPSPMCQMQLPEGSFDSLYQQAVSFTDFLVD